MNIIRNFNRFITDRGVSPNNSSGINLSIRFTNVTSFFLALMILPYIFIFRFMGSAAMANLCIPIVLVYFSISTINYLGYTKFSRMLMTIIGHIIVLVYSITFGKDSGIYQLFIMTSFYSIMYFDKSEKAKQIFSITLTFFSVFTFQYLSVYREISLIELSEGTALLLSQLIFVTTMILVVVFILFYYVSKNRIVGELEDSLSLNKESLVNSRERFKILFERTNDAIFLIDEKTSKYLDANSAAELLTGRTVEELKKCTTYEITPIGSRDRMKKYVSSKRTMDLGEVIYIRPDGSERISLLSIIPIDDNLFFGFARDITESKKSQELLIQNEKMLSIGGLAAGMAHEINNPLAGLLQTANVMNNRLGMKLGIPKSLKAAEKAGTSVEAIKSFMIERQIDKMLENIIESGERISVIVSNMLSFVRNSEKKKSFYSMAEIIDNTLELASADYNIKEETDFRNIKIHKEYDDFLPEIYCERSKIQQVLLNIFRNCADILHSEKVENPQVYIRVYRDRGGAKIVLEIEDNGPGIDDQTKKRVFEPFFTTKPEGKGTGLGLSISYFIITEDHKGELSVDSKMNHGTIFTIKLPIISAEIPLVKSSYN